MIMGFETHQKKEARLPSFGGFSVVQLL